MKKAENNNPEKFSVEEDKPADWFEPLYASSSKQGEGVPWANMATHPSFGRWLDKHSLDGGGKQALVVGCGMGDDAIELQKLGYQVTAFDISETAIKYCRERFSESNVDFVQADLLRDQPQWHEKFDFVLEIYTIQALPPKYEAQLIQSIAEYVGINGKLLVIAEVSNAKRAFEKGPPWPLTPDHIASFVSCGLGMVDSDIEQESSGLDGSQTYVTTFERSKS